MNEFLNQLLGTEALRFGDEGVRLGLARSLAPWGWALVIGAAALLAGWAYWKLDAGRRSRIALATVRMLLMLFVVLLILGPRLERQNETIEPDWVVVLTDRSGSMQVADVEPALAGASRTTRDQQLRAALASAYPSLKRIAAERELLVMGFDASAYPIGTIEDEQGLGPIDLPPAIGTRTSISTALSQALARTAARPVAGIVLLSDGRTAERPDKGLMRRLQGDRIPVFPYALGSPSPIGDLAVTRVEAPTVAFVRDTIPVQVRVERRGDASATAGGDTTVELVDQLTGKVFESRPLSEASPDPNDPASLALTLSGSETDAGAREWTVRLVTTRPDLITENNQRSFSVDLLDRPIRTVYFDGYPRWEYRYVKNLLIREGSINSSNLLLAVERRFLQEGDSLLRSIPRSSEEWAPFDVVIMGDLRPDLFTTEQLQQIREHVAMRGGGLLWMAGSGSTPGGWAETPLADLLPFAMGAGSGARGGASVRIWDRTVVVRPTPASERLGLLNLSQPRGWPAQLASPDTGWSQLRWAQRIDPSAVKPSAEVLAMAVPADGQGEPTPLVMTMRYGAGRVIYVATDETWRWRYAKGETLQERFWLPLVRLLARDSVARTGMPAVLELSQSVVPVEQPVRIAVRLLDQSLVDAAPAAIRVRLVPVGENAVGRAPVNLRLQQESEGVARGGVRTYAGAWVALEPGEYRVETAEPLLAGIGLQQPLSIILPDNEMRTPETDHGLLADLAIQSGGQMLTLQDLLNLDEILPNRQVRIVTPPTTETLWDTPLALIVFLTLACTEWIGRKLIRLV